MKAEEFVASFLQAVAERDDIVVEQHPLVYSLGSYSFLKIKSKEIGPTDRIIMIFAGLHGEEIAGPLTILHCANQIIDAAHEINLKIILYPLCNPSGFEKGTRYSIDSTVPEDKEIPNNDFLRYELADGTIVKDIGRSGEFLRWHWSSDPELKIMLPHVETRLMHTLLQQDPLMQVSAVIELHQDYLTKNAPPAAYFYAYGDLERYRYIARAIDERIVPLLKNKKISAGYPDGTAMTSDEYGLIVRHDGSVSDLLYRIGARRTITVETTGATALETAEFVNMIWIYQIIDMAGG